jgi:hypothetical protein
MVYLHDVARLLHTGTNYTGPYRSRHYFIVALPSGTNWLDHFNLPLLKVNTAARPKLAEAPPLGLQILDITGLHAQAPPPERGPVTVTDELFRGVMRPGDGHLLIHDVMTGKYYGPDGRPAAEPKHDDRKTTRIKVHVAPPPSVLTAYEQRQHELSRLTDEPHSFVGECAWVRFPDHTDAGRKEHRGRVVATFSVGRRQRWQVVFDDTDTEQWHHDEMVHYVIDGFSTRHGQRGVPRKSVPRDRVHDSGALSDSDDDTDGATGSADAATAPGPPRGVAVRELPVDLTRGATAAVVSGISLCKCSSAAIKARVT